MAKAAFSTACLPQGLDRKDMGVKNRQKNELSNALALENFLFLRRGIEQRDLDLSPIIRVNHPNALTHGQAVFGTQSASGEHKPSDSWLGDLYGNASGKKIPVARGQHDLVAVHTSPQIETGGECCSIGAMFWLADRREEFYSNVQMIGYVRCHNHSLSWQWEGFHVCREALAAINGTAHAVSLVMLSAYYQGKPLPRQHASLWISGLFFSLPGRV